jgi:nicotinamide-nucleotide amidase
LFDKSVIILVVSREILEGSVVDRNAAFIANRIDDIGYRVRTIQVVDRVESEMVAALSWALEQKPTFVLLTGGMGPNWDDNSRGCLAKASGLPLEEDAKALEFIANSYRRLHAKEVIDDPNLNDSRRGMANCPRARSATRTRSAPPRRSSCASVQRPCSCCPACPPRCSASSPRT